MGALRGHDVLIAISKGGRSSGINKLVRRAQGRGVTVVALTSELASLASPGSPAELDGS